MELEGRNFNNNTTLSGIFSWSLGWGHLFKSTAFGNPHSSQKNRLYFDAPVFLTHTLVAIATLCPNRLDWGKVSRLFEIADLGDIAPMYETSLEFTAINREALGELRYQTSDSPELSRFIISLILIISRCIQPAAETEEQ